MINPQPSSWNEWRVSPQGLVEALRLLGIPFEWPSAPLEYSRFRARIYPGLRGPDALEWNSLGAPIQLVNGNRYLSRWLVQLPQPSVNQPQQNCSDVLNTVKNALQAASYSQGWPWQSLNAYGFFSETPAGWPSNMRFFPFEHPGACLVFLDGVWSSPTTTVDSANLPALPGARAMDFRDGTTGQTLVEEPRPASPCDPASLTFDIVTGIFKCAGQVIPAVPPVVAPPPFQVPPLTPPVTTPPVNVPPTQTPPTGVEKKEKSVVPWLIGGALLIGGGVLLAKAG